MADTTFVSGVTTVSADWLNDINDKVYHLNLGNSDRALVNKLQEFVSVKDYGALGDNSTNDTVAIQAALNSGAKIVFFPQGNYIFSTLTIPQRVTLKGEGIDVTILKTSTTGDAITLNGERITIKHMTLDQTGSVQGKGIVGADKYWFSTEYLKVTGFQYGLYCDRALYHSHKQSWFEDGTYGAYYWGASGTWNTDWYNNVITFDTCRFNGNSNTGCYVKGTEVVFINPDFSNITSGIGVAITGDSTQPAHGIEIISPYAEGTDIPFSFDYAYVKIEGGFVQGGTAAGASAFTSILDADNCTVTWGGRVRDQDYWDNGYRLTSSRLTMDYSFTGSVRASNSADSLSSVSVDDSEEGSYTATLTGCTTSPTTTVQFVRKGKMVTLYIPGVTATSNTTGCSLTGGPASIRPTNTQYDGANVVDNSVNVWGTCAMFSTGTLVIYNGAAGNTFTGSGTKGIGTSTINYLLV